MQLGILINNILFSFQGPPIIKIRMQANTNILDHHVNIQTYLNLGDPCVAQPSPIFAAVQPDSHDPLPTSLLESQILLCKAGSVFHHPASTLASEFDSVSQKKSAKEATAKYRERRKMYQQELQASVKNLQQQIQNTDAEIKKVKDAVLVKLESSVKAAVHSTENAQIYLQLQSCLPKAGEDEELADIDKINLLLNTLKYRIGPSGRERHAKIEYNFKNIVNTLFPGLHRYFLITATKNVDMFANEDQIKMEWTCELLKKMNLSGEQQKKVREFQGKLKEMHQGTLDKIRRLQVIKRKMKEESLMADSAEDDMRDGMNPTQCARLTMFAEKFKYRKEISLDGKFKPKKCGSMIEEEMEELLQCQLGRKRVHLDPLART